MSLKISALGLQSDGNTKGAGLGFARGYFSSGGNQAFVSVYTGMCHGGNCNCVGVDSSYPVTITKKLAVLFTEAL
jgi:hypothetical protein